MCIEKSSGESNMGVKTYVSFNSCTLGRDISKLKSKINANVVLIAYF